MHLQLDETAEARSLLRRALEVFESSNEPEEDMHLASCVFLARLDESLNNLENARELLERAIRVGESAPTQSVVRFENSIFNLDGAP